MPAPRRTDRLLLRPFTEDDIPDIARLAGDRDVALNTLNIPHPYEPEFARAWIATHADGVERHSPVVFAIERHSDGRLIGAVGITLNPLHRRAELGYWIAREAWGQGYCTEAARDVLHYAFDVLHLDRVHASHFARNPASGRVMQKLGMVREGVLRAHVVKWERREDLVFYGILREEFGA